jgi:hypothetical protein
VTTKEPLTCDVSCPLDEILEGCAGHFKRNPQVFRDLRICARISPAPTTLPSLSRDSAPAMKTNFLASANKSSATGAEVTGNQPGRYAHMSMMTSVPGIGSGDGVRTMPNGIGAPFNLVCHAVSAG